MHGLIIFAYLLIAAASCRAGDPEERYYTDHCLPVARAFIRTQPVGYDPFFPTNKVTHWKVEPATETKAFVSRLSIEKGRVTFLFLGRADTNYVMVFADHSQWRSDWEASGPGTGRDYTQRQKTLAAQTNLLNTNTALTMARECLGRSGHDERDFDPPKVQQIILEKPGLPNLALPLYHFEWRHRKVPASKDGSAYLSPVTMTISGATSNLVEYSNLLPDEITFPMRR